MAERRVLVRIFAPAVTPKDSTIAISPVKPGRALASCSANATRNPAGLLQDVVRKLGISARDNILCFNDTDNSSVEIDRLFHQIQAGKHQIMLPVVHEIDKDVISLICVVQPKPPAFAQPCLLGSGSGGGGGGCLQQAPPARRAPTRAAQWQLDQSIVSRLDFSGTENPYEFDDERTTSDSDRAGDAGDWGGMCLWSMVALGMPLLRQTPS